MKISVFAPGEPNLANRISEDLSMAQVRHIDTDVSVDLFLNANFTEKLKVFRNQNLTTLAEAVNKRYPHGRSRVESETILDLKQDFDVAISIARLFGESIDYQRLGRQVFVSPDHSSEELKRSWINSLHLQIEGSDLILPMASCGGFLSSSFFAAFQLSREYNRTVAIVEDRPLGKFMLFIRPDADIFQVASECHEQVKRIAREKLATAPVLNMNYIHESLKRGGEISILHLSRNITIDRDLVLGLRSIQREHNLPAFLYDTPIGEKDTEEDLRELEEMRERYERVFLSISDTADFSGAMKIILEIPLEDKRELKLAFNGIYLQLSPGMQFEDLRSQYLSQFIHSKDSLIFGAKIRIGFAGEKVRNFDPDELIANMLAIAALYDCDVCADVPSGRNDQLIPFGVSFGMSLKDALELFKSYDQ